MEELKRHIYFLRINVGLSWNRVAEEVGISRQTIWKWRKYFDCEGVGKLLLLNRVGYFSHSVFYYLLLLDESIVTEMVFKFIRDSPGRGVELSRGFLRSNNVIVTREHVRDAVRTLDPEGTEMRKRKTIRRRVYQSNGIHHVWHMDGWHKLIKYGLVVHAAVDGGSRYVVFSHCSSNNQALTVLRWFLGGCEELGVIPGSVRTDKGGENVEVFRFMMKVFNNDPLCFKASSSCHNQPIERNWRDMRNSTLQPYKDFFLYLESLGLNVDNAIHMFCLHYLFVPRINESLQEFRSSWNNHGLSTERYKSPLSILFTEANSNGGVPWIAEVIKDTIEEVLSSATTHDVRQVHCAPRSCPLNERQYDIFCAHVQPFRLVDALQDLATSFFDIVEFTLHLVETIV